MGKMVVLCIGYRVGDWSFDDTQVYTIQKQAMLPGKNGSLDSWIVGFCLFFFYSGNIH